MENNYEPNVFENQIEENKRPGFLTFLCVLTFMGSGFSLLIHLLMPIMAPMALEFLKESSFANVPGILEPYEQFMVTPIWKFYMVAFFCATSIIGAIYMLKMKKIGFHIYAVSQLVLLATSLFIFGGSLKPGYTDLFFTILFIGLYAIYYKKFTAIEEEKI
jgi:hypothetical protein